MARIELDNHSGWFDDEKGSVGVIKLKERARDLNKYLRKLHREMSELGEERGNNEWEHAVKEKFAEIESAQKELGEIQVKLVSMEW